jgi:protein involved in polysaccharide export with SLBB domain
LTAARTLLQLIALAGGFTEFASPSRIVILRNEGDVQRQIDFNFNRAVSRRGGQQNIELQPGDIVLVP